MRFYDTASAEVTYFMPPESGSIGMYVCGVTPYDAAHVGHIFTFMAYDLLQRRLEDMGHEVRMVRNITDVDEPIFARAAELGEDYRDIAARETKRLQSVLAALHFRPATAEPKASDYVLPMAEAVNTMLHAGVAYQLGDDVYFDVSKDTDFAASAHVPVHLLRPLMASRGGDPDRPGKRGPLDFLLWRGVQDHTDPAAWNTVIGRGRPGWHIECTVMSQALLGSHFDIHGGGMDLIFPHHASEQAQSRALHGAGPSRYWLHVAPLLLYGEKMSKSLGNLVFAHDLLQDWSPAAMRLALMKYHYRIGGEWQGELLGRSEALATRLKRLVAAEQLPDTSRYLSKVRELLDNDLDTPAIVAALEAMVEDPAVSSQDLDRRRADLTSTYALLGLG